MTQSLREEHRVEKKERLKKLSLRAFPGDTVSDGADVTELMPPVIRFVPSQ